MLVGSKKYFGELTSINDLPLSALGLLNRVVESIIQKSNQNFSDIKAQTIDYLISSSNSSEILHASKEINTYQSATIQYNLIDVCANNSEATIKALSNMYEQDLMEQWGVSADDKRGIALAKSEADRMARTQVFDVELTDEIIGSGNSSSDEIAQQIYNKVKQRQQDAADAMEAIKQENEKYKYFYNVID